ncbi:MAG: hypothetical protein PHP37_01275 [Patescibacteria group bacterium]|nr:hypothetical protein [Patescibacteria group bacterium]
MKKMKSFSLIVALIAVIITVFSSCQKEEQYWVRGNFVSVMNQYNKILRIEKNDHLVVSSSHDSFYHQIEGWENDYAIVFSEGKLIQSGDTDKSWKFNHQLVGNDILRISFYDGDSIPRVGEESFPLTDLNGDYKLYHNVIAGRSSLAIVKDDYMPGSVSVFKTGFYIVF